METVCKGCGQEGGFYPPVGLCPKCRRRVRDAARVLVEVLWCLASDEVLSLLHRLAWRASTMHDGTAAEFMERTSVPVTDFDGWALASEVAA